MRDPQLVLLQDVLARIKTRDTQDVKHVELGIAVWHADLVPYCESLLSIHRNHRVKNFTVTAFWLHASTCLQASCCVVYNISMGYRHLITATDTAGPT